MEMTKEQYLSEVAKNVLEVFTRRVIENCDPWDEYQGYSVEFNTYHTYTDHFRIMLKNISPGKSEEKSIIVAGVFPDGSGYIMSVYKVRGNKEKILKYLNDENTVKDIAETMLDIDKSIKEKGGQHRER